MRSAVPDEPVGGLRHPDAVDEPVLDALVRDPVLAGLQQAHGLGDHARPGPRVAVEHREGDVLRHVREVVRGGAGARRVHEVHQGALLGREAHALVPHLGESVEARRAQSTAQREIVDAGRRQPRRQHSTKPELDCTVEWRDFMSRSGRVDVILAKNWPPFQVQLI